MASTAAQNKNKKKHIYPACINAQHRSGTCNHSKHRENVSHRESFLSKVVAQHLAEGSKSPLVTDTAAEEDVRDNRRVGENLPVWMEVVDHGRNHHHPSKRPT